MTELSEPWTPSLAGHWKTESLAQMDMSSNLHQAAYLSAVPRQGQLPTPPAVWTVVGVRSSSAYKYPAVDLIGSESEFWDVSVLGGTKVTKLARVMWAEMALVEPTSSE